jgi:aspartate dehydrogenase
MKTLGLIGCGVIGSAVLNAVQNDVLDQFEIIGIFDLQTNEIIEKSKIPLVDNVEDLILLGPDLIFEAAGYMALIENGLAVVTAGIDLIPMSLAAFANEEFSNNIQNKAKENNTTLFIPSGAIGCLDILRSSGVGGGIDRVVLSSTKKPAALAGQPYLIENGIEIDGLEAPLTVFEGNAAEACISFPKSMNIAGAISLAGLGFHKTEVQLIADPQTPRTIHRLKVSGAFGKLELTVQNFPHPDNPSTTFLASFSAVSALKNLQGSVRFV